ncbi:MAG: hypothetical protein Q8P67_11105, partial [archaeon]|nr:hypothetical protein [archaeon]
GSAFYPNSQQVQQAQARLSRILEFLGRLFSPDSDQRSLESALRSMSDAEIGYVMKVLENLSKNPKLHDSSQAYMKASHDLRKYLSSSSSPSPAGAPPSSPTLLSTNSPGLLTPSSPMPSPRPAQVSSPAFLSASAGASPLVKPAKLEQQPQPQEHQHEQQQLPDDSEYQGGERGEGEHLSISNIPNPEPPCYMQIPISQTNYPLASPMQGSAE